MLQEAVYHRPKLNWAYAYDERNVHLRVRTKRNDVDVVNAIVGDKYAWDRTRIEVAMRKFATDEWFDYWEVSVEPPYRRLRYAFQFIDEQDVLYMTEKGFSQTAPPDSENLFDYGFINPIDVFTLPEWVKDAVFYQIFPERFANGDPSNDPDNVEEWGGEPTPVNFFGGDLQGVIDHLDYLEDLGVNAIYFNPLFDAPTNHKYDTRDYLKVDPQFGTNKKLKELVEKCHARGIRVLLDAVFNHSGRLFPPFVDVLEKGSASLYADWFHIREFPLHVVDGIPTYDTFAFEHNMPKLNTENPEVKDYLLNIARYWIEEIDIDGWRLDVADEVDHSFWRAFRDTVKAMKPDAYILGEIWHDSIMWLQGDQFDAIMNYSFTSAVIDFFAEEKVDARQFKYAIGTQLASYQQQVTETSFNLLGSHDTPRLLTRCNEHIGRMKLASLFQLTYPGPPCIYYGDEIGISGGGDPYCRACMIWEEDKQNKHLLQFFKTVIALRHKHPALRSANLRFLQAEKNSSLLVYERSDSNGERFIIALNASNESVSVTVPAEGLWQDVLTRESVALQEGSLQAELSAYGYAIWYQN